MRVLLVDANAVSARVMALYLSGWRIDATVVATAGEAESAWSAALDADRPFAVVIVDVKGLGAAGVALAAKVRASEPGPAAEVIALVGIDSFAADDTVERLGAFAVLTKPARPSELFNCLASLAAGAQAGQVVPFFARRMTRATRPQFEARVLIAEDNAVNREVAVGMLEAMGCRVVTTLHGREAAERFARDRFDVVLMDCEMPVMDGFEASRRIREIEARVAAGGAPGDDAARPRTPIVAVTAHALTTVHEKCLQAGMDDFLVKPFDELQLAQALRRWLPGRERTPAGADAVVPPAIDLATIDKIRAIRGDSALLQRVISQFLGMAPGMVAEMRARTEASDAEAVWRAAHGLKSSAAAIGAHTLAERCAAIEAAARRQGDLPDGAGLDALDAALAAATQSLAELT
jgi:CheY-like chemotaxis protein/HPt (histidine-containing phosphotransfer) domain-containing protein